MKITLLKNCGMAIPSKEGIEHIEENKLFVHCHDEEGTLIRAGAKISGRVFSTSQGIPLKAFQEGDNLLTIIYENKTYPAANITRTGNKLDVKPHESYDIMYRTCVNAEKAVRRTQKFHQRLEALERAYNGVDLMNLH